MMNDLKACEALAAETTRRYEWGEGEDLRVDLEETKERKEAEEAEEVLEDLMGGVHSDGESSEEEDLELDGID